MKGEETWQIVTCDNPSCGEKVPLEQATKWYQMQQARTGGMVDALDRLDFCSNDCVEEFTNLEIIVVQPRALVVQQPQGLRDFVVGIRR